MFQPSEVNATTTCTIDAHPGTSASPVNGSKSQAASTKDAGRVHIGGGMMRFASTKDAGRVHVGGGMMRF